MEPHVLNMMRISNSEKKNTKGRTTYRYQTLPNIYIYIYSDQPKIYKLYIYSRNVTQTISHKPPRKFVFHLRIKKKYGIYSHPPNGKLKFYLLQGWLVTQGPPPDYWDVPLHSVACGGYRPHWRLSFMAVSAKGLFGPKNCEVEMLDSRCWFLFFLDLKVEHMVTTWISQVVLLIESVSSWSSQNNQNLNHLQAAASHPRNQFRIRLQRLVIRRKPGTRAKVEGRDLWGFLELSSNYCQFFQGFRHFGWVSLTQNFKVILTENFQRLKDLETWNFSLGKTSW